jgi:NTE family protein
MTLHVELQSPRAQRRNGVPRPLNLALLGSGAHGAFGWGVLDKFAQDGRVDIAGLAATGAGAMNAVVFAQGLRTGGIEGARAALESFWRKVSASGAWTNPLQRTALDHLFGIAEPWPWRWFDTVAQSLSPYDVNPLNLSPMRGILDAAVDFETLRRQGPTIPLAITATDIRTARARAFSGRQITVDAVLAAACQPNLSHAVEIEGEHYWDGTYSGGPLLGPLIANSAARDVLVAGIGAGERRKLPRSAAEIQARANEIVIEATLLREARALAAVTQLIDDDWIRPEHKNKLARIHVHAIPTAATLSGAGLAAKCDTSWRTLTSLRDAGRLAAELWLETHFDRIGIASTIDLNGDRPC